MFTIKKLPNDWQIIRDGIFRTHGYLGYCDIERKVIYLPYINIPFFVFQHEGGHAWGIESCPNCIMAEENNKLKEIFIGVKLLLKKREIFCQECQIKIQNAMNDEKD